MSPSMNISPGVTNARAAGSTRHSQVFRRTSTIIALLQWASPQPGLVLVCESPQSSNCSPLTESYSGGVMYPIMLQHLFERVGFGWGVRVSALVSGVGCGVALLTLTALTPGQKRGSCTFGLCSTFKDGRFNLLMVGSSLVALGRSTPPP